MKGRLARDIALFGGMTALSVLAMVVGDTPLVGLMGVLLFGGGGAAYFALAYPRRRAAGARVRRSSLVHGRLAGAAAHTARPHGVVFPGRRGAALAVVAGAAVFCAVGLGLVAPAVFPGLPPPSRLGSGDSARVLSAALGGVTVLVFATFGVLGTAALLGRRGGIALLPEGVYLSAPAGRGWVVWEDLASVGYIASGPGGGYVSLLAHTPEAFRLTAMNRLLQRVNRRGYQMDVGFPASFLRHDPREVAMLCRQCRQDPALRDRLDDPGVLDELRGPEPD